MHAIPVSKVSMFTNSKLVMFYLTYFMENDVYYLENYDAIVIAAFKEDIMEVLDVFLNEDIPLDRILNAITRDRVKK